jgi:hypothetical protein
VIADKQLASISRFAGLASILVLVGATAAVAFADSVPFSVSAPLFILGQLTVSVWFTIVGFKTKARWMPLWLLFFYVLLPPATVAFWFLNRHRDFRLVR